MYNKEYETNKLRFNKAIAKCAELIINKNSKILNKNDYEEIANTYFNNNITNKPIAIAKIKRLMSTELAQNRVNALLESKLLEHKLDVDSVFSTLKQAITAANAKNDASTLLQISKYLAELNNIMPKKQVITATQESNYTQLANNATNALAERKETLQIKQEN